MREQWGGAERARGGGEKGASEGKGRTGERVVHYAHFVLRVQVGPLGRLVHVRAQVVKVRPPDAFHGRHRGHPPRHRPPQQGEALAVHEVARFFQVLLDVGHVATGHQLVAEENLILGGGKKGGE